MTPSLTSSSFAISTDLREKTERKKNGAHLAHEEENSKTCLNKNLISLSEGVSLHGMAVATVVQVGPPPPPPSLRSHSYSYSCFSSLSSRCIGRAARERERRTLPSSLPPSHSPTSSTDQRAPYVQQPKGGLLKTHAAPPPATKRRDRGGDGRTMQPSPLSPPPRAAHRW